MKVVYKGDDGGVSFQLKLSDDGLKLFLDATPKGKKAVKGAELAILFSKGIGQADFDKAVLDDIAKGLSDGKPCKERRIAKGQEAKNGANGKLLLLVKKFELKPKYREVEEEKQRRISFTNLHLFDNIKKGQVVARVYPPKNGEDGIDVFGKKIAALPGEPFKVALDKSLVLNSASEGNERFETVVSELEGYLCEESGKLMIKEELVIPGDLDFRFGNINFIGSLKVQGDVSPGFTLSAPKGVTVQGAVRESRIASTQGDVVIKGFLFGGRNSLVVTGQNFYGAVIQEARIEAAGVISISKEATDCILRTEKGLLMPEGTLVGGEIFSVMGVECKRIGNEATKRTVIRLCNSVEVSAQYEKLLLDIENHEKAKKLLELHLGPYAKNTSRIEFVSGPHRDKLRALAAKHKAVQDGRIALLARKKEMLESGRGVEGSRVNILSEAFPGLVVKVSETAEFELKDPLKGPKSIVFDVEKGSFEVQELKPLEIALEKGEKDGKKRR